LETASISRAPAFAGAQDWLKPDHTLGLDAARCWIMTTEVNRFKWPGPDIRPMTRNGERTPYYGFIPHKLFAPVLAAVIARLRAGRMKVTKRGN
jgi:hypothetical protein